MSRWERGRELLSVGGVFDGLADGAGGVLDGLADRAGGILDGLADGTGGVAAAWAVAHPIVVGQIGWRVFRAIDLRARDYFARFGLKAERPRGNKHRFTSKWTTIELEAALHEAGVPCAPIQDVAELLRHPQTRTSGFLAPLPGTPEVPVVTLPVRWDDEVFPVRRAPPARAQ